MTTRRLQTFFGDDLEETWDSIRSVPGAFGNIALGVYKQVRLPDAIAFAVVLAGLAALVIGHFFAGDRSLVFYVASVLPLALWFAAGIAGGLIYHIGAIGLRSLGYWESYVLMVLFGVFGLISLRTAIDPRGRRVYRSTQPGPDL